MMRYNTADFEGCWVPPGSLFLFASSSERRWIMNRIAGDDGHGIGPLGFIIFAVTIIVVLSALLDWLI